MDSLVHSAPPTAAFFALHQRENLRNCFIHMAITRELTIQNKLGIHARPAAQFVKTANRFSCEVRVEKDGEEVEGKSIMGLMMLAAGHGSVITVTTEGDDEAAAMNAIADLIDRKFEED